MTETVIISRDQSWLDFNHRVLQEASDPTVPLYERLHFLAIYSSNLDEFYRVRVAALRSFRKIKKKQRRELFDFKPKKELNAIRELVQQQQEQFGRIFRTEILPALEAEHILLRQPEDLSEAQCQFAHRYFEEQVKKELSKKQLVREGEVPFLENRQQYLLVETQTDEHLYLINIPTAKLPRFVVLPPDPVNHFCTTFLDDIIRVNLEEWLEEPIRGAYAIKLSRDADLYIDNEYSGDLLEKIKAALEDRDSGLPTRFLYDANMPETLVRTLKASFGMSKHDMIPGARYHNFHDFFDFPCPQGRADLNNPPLDPLPHPVLEGASSILATMAERDLLLHFPYQKYDYVPALIREAADHPEVTDIKITLYRVAKKSSVVEALLYARQRDKKVRVFVEAKARFDEESNLYWGSELERAGAKVRYSYPGIKVHTKLLQVTRISPDREKTRYTYVGTGNFNEKTARIYADHALITTDRRIGDDVAKVFELLEGDLIVPNSRHLLVAPFNMRDRFVAMIDREIQHARAGKFAEIFVKLNSLEEMGMIEKLRMAADAGVRVRLVVRGICRLNPGEEEENLEIISIVDRFLEHARVYVFENNGEREVYLGSADWMSRNLFKRVEVVTPIFDQALQEELMHILEMQWRDNTKARQVRAERDNPYRQPATPDSPEYRAQIDTYHYFAQQASTPTDEPEKTAG